MAGYSVIADMTGYLVRLLRDNMCPEPVMAPLSIDAASPADESAGLALSVYLYDIFEKGELASAARIPTGSGLQRLPPKVYALSYMINVSQNSQNGMKQADIQKILGKASQVMGDHSVIDPRQVSPWQSEGDQQVGVHMDKLDFEQKQRIWTAFNKPYSPALYYTVYPVSICSEKTFAASRVRSASFDIRMEGDTR